jgi:L-threonylcarbamoyladenylate synthase
VDERPLSPAAVSGFERCIESGGVAVFPADTVYGLACDPDSTSAIARMYRMKGRSPDRPAAVMFFGLEGALAALPEIGASTEAAVRKLLPGPVTVVLPNPDARFPFATGERGLGLRVPLLQGMLAPLAAARVPVLQTSANESGGRDARRLAEVPEAIRSQADVTLDGGELAGTPSTVIDLSQYESGGLWEVLRVGALDELRVRDLLDSV